VPGRGATRHTQASRLTTGYPSSTTAQNSSTGMPPTVVPLNEKHASTTHATECNHDERPHPSLRVTGLLEQALVAGTMAG
jgi:hypothetical protein